MILLDGTASPPETRLGDHLDEGTLIPPDLVDITSAEGACADKELVGSTGLGKDACCVDGLSTTQLELNHSIEYTNDTYFCLKKDVWGLSGPCR